MLYFITFVLQWGGSPAICEIVLHMCLYDLKLESHIKMYTQFRKCGRIRMSAIYFYAYLPYFKRTRFRSIANSPRILYYPRTFPSANLQISAHYDFNCWFRICWSKISILKPNGIRGGGSKNICVCNWAECKLFNTILLYEGMFSAYENHKTKIRSIKTNSSKVD